MLPIANDIRQKNKKIKIIICQWYYIFENLQGFCRGGSLLNEKVLELQSKQKEKKLCDQISSKIYNNFNKEKIKLSEKVHNLLSSKSSSTGKELNIKKPSKLSKKS